MKQSFLLFMLLLCFWQCTKEENEGDLSGQEYIRGRLFLFDMLTQNANGIPQGEKKINISYASSTDTLNYLFSTSTDKEGYFIFLNLKEKTPYKIYYEEIIDGKLYQGRAFAEAPIDTLRLNCYISTSGQNGIHITVIDETGSLIKGATVCAFNSPLVSGYTNNACDGSTFKITSDAQGHAFMFSIPQGNYYLNSSLAVNEIQLMSKDTVIVPIDRIIFDTIRLSTPNGMKFTVMDTLGTRLSGANICVFTSQALFQRDTCEYSNFQLTSMINGETSRFNLFPQRYYIYCTLKAGNDIWVDRDTLDLNIEIVHDTLILRKK